MKKVLLARVGFMKFYQGPKPGDEKPIGGGSYNSEEIGHEAYNFLGIEGNLYGYFQPHMRPPYEVNLARIEPGSTGDSVQDVLVIWFATNPVDKGQVVIGWYNNATVFQSFQQATPVLQRGNCGYNVVARANTSVLLPLSNRKFPIGHGIDGSKKGNPGQANAFYIRDAQGNQKDLLQPNNAWIQELVEYVEGYDGPTIASREDHILEDILTAEHSSGGQGIQSDVEIRLMIESYAMETCRAHYLGHGFEVEDVSARESYDFVITKDGRARFVEVKGTQAAGDTIILTKNEVNLSRSTGENMVLFLVHSIAMNKRTVRKGSGVVHIIEPWRIMEERLTPISFTYRLS